MTLTVSVRPVRPPGRSHRDRGRSQMFFSWVSRHRGSIIVLVVSAVVAAVSVSYAFRQAAGGSVPDRPARTSTDPTLRIMPLGDSITEGVEAAPGSYRVELAKLLTADQRPFTFVGSNDDSPPELAQYPQHEGHSGWCLATCTDNLHDHLPDWLAATHPDVVLLDAGTNDLREGASRDEMVNRLRLVVDDIYRAAPDTHLYIAQIRNGGTFNDGVVVMAAQARAAGRFAAVVNMDDSGGFGDDDYVDGIHPNARGADRMARTWYAALRDDGY